MCEVIIENVRIIVKNNKYKYSYILKKVECIDLFCSFDFFYLSKNKKCRSPPSIDSKKNWLEVIFMDKNPKRRKYQDNPYSISKDEEKNLYFVSFADGTGIKHEVEITRAIWEVFDEFERLDLSQMNEFDRHTEHLEIYEDSLVTRAKERVASLEDDFIKQVNGEVLKNAVDKLDAVQRKRIKLYYFEDLNVYQIAEIEQTTHQAISESITRGINNLRKIIKK